MTRARTKRLPEIVREVARCSRWPRLGRYLEELRARFPDYHNAPVGGFGDPEAWLGVVGLAPGLHGANRSGRAALLLTPQGRLLPVRPGAVRGSVARVRIDFRGEAFADSVLLFSGGEFLAEQRSGGASPMKFEFPVPFTMGSGEADDAVQRFVAIDGFVASEIVGSWREDADAPWSGEPAHLSWRENDGQPEIARSTGERIAVDGSIDAVQRGAVLTFVDGKFEGLDVLTESRRVGESESEASEKHSALLSEDGLLFRISQ